MKLTAGRISGLRLPPGKADHIEWDDDIPGFGVRLREGGARGFVFQYKVGGRHRRMNLGAVSAVTFVEHTLRYSRFTRAFNSFKPASVTAVSSRESKRRLGPNAK